MEKNKPFFESLNIKIKSFDQMTPDEKEWFQRLDTLMTDFPETLNDGEGVDVANFFSPYRIETRDETGKVIKSARVSKEEYLKWKRREKELKAQKAWEDAWTNRPVWYKAMLVVLWILLLAIIALMVFMPYIIPE